METKKISFKLNSTKRKEPSPAVAESIFGSLDDDLTAAELPPASKAPKYASEDAIAKSKRLQDEGNAFAERGAPPNPIRISHTGGVSPNPNQN